MTKHTSSSFKRMAYWALPEEIQLERYQRVIDELAGTFQGPTFLPHVTLYAGQCDPKDNVNEILEQLSSFAPLVLTVRGLHFTEAYNKSCFIQFRTSDALSEMCELIRRSIHVPTDYRVDPHMSLFYGQLNDGARKAIEEKIELPETLQLRIVSAVGSQRKTETREDVESWCEIARRELCSKP